MADEQKCGECHNGIVTGEPYDGDSTCAETWPCPACNGTGHKREVKGGLQDGD